MSAGDAAGGLRRRLRAVVLAFVAVAAAGAAWAVDNPDAPDRAAAFEARVQPLEDALAATSGGPASARAGQALAEQLDAELNRAYGELSRALEAPARQALQASQRQWLRWRDAELAFAERQWTPQRSGSSYTLSRALHRAALIKARVAALNAALADYPAYPAAPATPPR
jgi:uncharacterized protein YecT (DUF1311 family)